MPVADVLLRQKGREPDRAETPPQILISTGTVVENVAAFLAGKPQNVVNSVT